MTYYKAGEILQKAVEIENKGVAFYSALAEKSEREDIKSLFSFLAGEEQAHKEKFAELLEKAGEFRSDFGFDYYDYLAGMEFMSEKGIFESDKKTVKETVLARDPESLIRTALQFEQDSIFCYSEMRPIVESASQPVLDQIIQEERTHITKLNQILSDISP